MSTPKAVSDYMRDMQRRSAKSRWSGMSADEKSAAMKALRSKGERKTKARALRQNAELSERRRGDSDQRFVGLPSKTTENPNKTGAK